MENVVELIVTSYTTVYIEEMHVAFKACKWNCDTFYTTKKQKTYSSPGNLLPLLLVLLFFFSFKLTQEQAIYIDIY